MAQGGRETGLPPPRGHTRRTPLPAENRPKGGGNVVLEAIAMQIDDARQDQVAGKIDLGKRPMGDPAFGQADRALLQRAIAQNMCTRQTQGAQNDRHRQAPAIG